MSEIKMIRAICAARSAIYDDDSDSESLQYELQLLFKDTPAHNAIINALHGREEEQATPESQRIRAIANQTGL